MAIDGLCVSFLTFCKQYSKTGLSPAPRVTEALIKVGSPFTDICKITRTYRTSKFLWNLTTVWSVTVLDWVITWVCIYASKKQQNFHDLILYCLSDALTQISISQLFRVELWTCDAIFQRVCRRGPFSLWLAFRPFFLGGSVFVLYYCECCCTHKLVTLWGKSSRETKFGQLGAEGGRPHRGCIVEDKA